MSCPSDQKLALNVVRKALELNMALDSSSDSNIDSEMSLTSSNGMTLQSSDSVIDLPLDSSSDSNSGQDKWELKPKVSSLLELYVVMEQTRYFLPRCKTPKSIDFATSYFLKLPDKMFRQIICMEKRSFFHLYDKIRGDLVFHSLSNHMQAPVETQLAVTLDRLGYYGNGACLLRMIPPWGVSTGSLCTFSRRCFQALENVLLDQVQWPGPIEREVISTEFAKFGFPDCVGLVDGTLIPILQRPKMDGECYWDRKSRYNINAQIICDH